MPSCKDRRWSEDGEKLLQSMAHLHNDRPGVSQRLLSSVELIWLDEMTEPRCSKHHLLEALWTILRFCGDFEVQSFALKCLTGNEDVADYGAYFIEVWFKSEPHLKPLFMSLLEETNIEGLNRFLCEFNKSANPVEDTIFQFVYSIPISFVYWNNCHLPSDGKGLTMLHLNLGSKCLKLKGVDKIPTSVQCRDYMVLQGNDIVQATVCDTHSIHGPVFQGLSIWTKNDQLLVHPEPALSQVEWSNVNNFLLYISSIGLEFIKSETKGTQTKHMNQQVPCRWQVSSSQENSVVSVQDEETDVVQMLDSSVQEDSEEGNSEMQCDNGIQNNARSSEEPEARLEAIKSSVGFGVESDPKMELGVCVNVNQVNLLSNTGQIFSENSNPNICASINGIQNNARSPEEPEAGVKAINSSVGTGVESDPKMELGVCLNGNQVNLLGNTGLIFSGNKNPNISCASISPSSTLDQSEADPETPKDSVGSGVISECEVECGFGIKIDLGNTSQILSENETVNPSDVICSSSCTLDQLEAVPEASTGSVNSDDTSNSENELGANMSIYQPNLLGVACQIFSENENLNTASDGISSSSTLDQVTCKGRKYTYNRKSTGRKRGGGRGRQRRGMASGGFSTSKRMKVNDIDPAVKSIACNNFVTPGRPATRSYFRRLSALMSGSEASLKEEPISSSSNQNSRNIKATTSISTDIDESTLVDSLHEMEHPVLLPMVDQTITSNYHPSLSVAGPLATAPSYNPFLTPNSSLTPRRDTTAELSLPSLMPTPASSPQQESDDIDQSSHVCNLPTTFPIYVQEMGALHLQP